MTEKGHLSFREEVTCLTSHAASCIIGLLYTCQEESGTPLGDLGRSSGHSSTLYVHNLSPLIWQVLKSHGQDYLVGNRLTRVDIHLLEVLLYVEELDSSLLAPFPLLKVRESEKQPHILAPEDKIFWAAELLTSGLQTELLDPGYMYENNLFYIWSFKAGTRRRPFCLLS